jgi:hypothetical protein
MDEGKEIRVLVTAHTREKKKREKENGTKKSYFFYQL